MARKPRQNRAAADERFARRMEAAAQSAAREALLLHKRLGNPVAAWKDNRVVWVPPEEIEIPEEPPEIRDGRMK